MPKKLKGSKKRSGIPKPGSSGKATSTQKKKSDEKSPQKKPRNKIKPKLAAAQFKEKTARSFTIRSAVPKEFRTNLFDTYNYVESHAAELDQKKDPKEYWAFALKSPQGLNNSLQVFSGIGRLIQKLHEYKDFETKKFITGAEYERLADAIVLIRWEGTPKQHLIAKEKEVKERVDKKKKLAEEIGFLKRSQKKLERENKRLQEQNKKLKSKKAANKNAKRTKTRKSRSK